LRLVHAIVFLGFSASALAAVYPEFLQLAAAWQRPFHAGAAPSGLALASGVTAAGVATLLVVNLARRRSTSLAASALLLAAFCGALVFRSQEVPAQRSWQGADLALLEVTRALHLKMVERLQKDAEVPREPGPWQEALTAAALKASPGGLSPIRSRSFAAQPYQVVKVPGQGAVPEGLPPAAVALWVSDDGVSFSLTPVGLLRDGAVGPLVDDSGAKVVFKGVFNPDLPRK
jgi:hypothetical protein